MSHEAGECGGMVRASIKASALPLSHASQCRTVDQVVMLPDGADAKAW
jgi:hypothetical protein